MSQILISQIRNFPNLNFANSKLVNLRVYKHTIISCGHSVVQQQVKGQDAQTKLAVHIWKIFLSMSVLATMALSRKKLIPISLSVLIENDVQKSAVEYLPIKNVKISDIFFQFKINLTVLWNDLQMTPCQIEVPWPEDAGFSSRQC